MIYPNNSELQKTSIPKQEDENCKFSLQPVQNIYMVGDVVEVHWTCRTGSNPSVLQLVQEYANVLFCARLFIAINLFIHSFIFVLRILFIRKCRHENVILQAWSLTESNGIMQVFLDAHWSSEISPLFFRLSEGSNAYHDAPLFWLPRVIHFGMPHSNSTATLIE